MHTGKIVVVDWRITSCFVALNVALAVVSRSDNGRLAVAAVDSEAESSRAGDEVSKSEP